MTAKSHFKGRGYNLHAAHLELQDLPFSIMFAHRPDGNVERHPFARTELLRVFVDIKRFELSRPLKVEFTHRSAQSSRCDGIGGNKLWNRTMEGFSGRRHFADNYLNIHIIRFGRLHPELRTHVSHHVGIFWENVAELDASGGRIVLQGRGIRRKRLRQPTVLGQIQTFKRSFRQRPVLSRHIHPLCGAARVEH